MGAAIALSTTFSTVAQSEAGAVTVRDVAGREVEVNVPVQRVILGEGRQIYLVAALDTEDPLRARRRLAGGLQPGGSDN